MVIYSPICLSRGTLPAIEHRAKDREMEQQVKLRHRETGFAGRHSHNIAYQIWTPHAHVLALKNKDFSRDPAVVATMNADPLIANETQPTKTVAEMVRADERLKREFPQITLPVPYPAREEEGGDEAQRQRIFPWPCRFC